ncbi:hypothetical protein DMENIID0001_155950 [Sergentomyia squamirostris]
MDRSSNLNEILKPINEFITLRSKERAEYMQHFVKVMKVVIDEVKKTSPLLNKMCKGFEFAGSYRDGLKVNKPDEYDLNIKLKLPLDVDDRVTIDGNSKPGFVRINIEKLLEVLPKFSGYNEVAKELGKLTNNEGYLLQNEVLSWFESVLTRSWSKIKSSLSSYTLSVRKQGPAQTIQVIFGPNPSVSFSVDFVVGIVFDSSIRWIATRDQPWEFIPEERYWIAIPKPMKSQENGSRSGNAFWITSYPAQESKLIHNKNRLKEATRFLKKIRDRRSLKLLKSYHIKTVIMLEIQGKADSYWNSPLGTVLRDMLNAVIKRFDQQCIPSYWNERFNMLEGWSPDQMAEVSKQLKAVKKTWDDFYDRDLVIKTILTDDEIKDMKHEQNVHQQHSNDRELDVYVPQRSTSHIGGSRPRVFCPEETQEIQQEDTSSNWLGIGLGVGAMAIGAAILYRTSQSRRE